ncbi:hypothetical protein JX265_004898 [Neoarthrinium moseri]|uniref:Uncharacterized protein n=1 Tax=Neoarthrinium moseri TaxID=1658444 RepID=A0A9Q0ARB1_9PEZI|nr:uncharacterized protein JN550_003599 [Neoarthrinium moseri]KAI1846929.1 hypothetical protein JX266_007150 [Neoarthrinium moseri]KAI1872725.1 hypothetical protein JN550_003599 [Neoarthrinium moseri]KAI1874690.1 hypothetical protein JX265_004898 [Neoarthrinium moseri]
MDFAPYQSSPPENSRPFSPVQSPSPRPSYDRGRPSNVASPPPLQHPQPQRQWASSNIPGAYQNVAAAPVGGAGFGGYGNEAGYGGVDAFDTSLGVRLDYEAAAAYLALPPLGAIVLLILERKSDYVRFHAWQSSLLFTTVFVLHLLFSWSTFFSWVIFLGDLALMAFMALKAYRDADTLDRFEVPIFGQFASRILDDE